MGDLILTFTGRDAPGITARISRALAQAGARLSDVEQVVVQGLLTLGFAVEAQDEPALLKELLFIAKELGLSLDYRKPDPPQGKAPRRYALTLIARTLGASELRTVSEILAAHGANIERIGRLSEGGLTSVEFAISLPGEDAPLERALLEAAGQGAFDCALQRETLLRRSKRLIVMDMDSTLIRIEVIDELARAAGVGAEVAKITERAMQGEMEYDESLRQRVALLAGLDVGVLDRIAADLPLTEGAETLIRVLKRLGYRTAFANRLPGLHAVRRGDDPHWLKRLPNKYIFALPGRGRRVWS